MLLFGLSGGPHAVDKTAAEIDWNMYIKLGMNHLIGLCRWNMYHGLTGSAGTWMANCSNFPGIRLVALASSLRPAQLTIRLQVTQLVGCLKQGEDLAAPTLGPPAARLEQGYPFFL